MAIGTPPTTTFDARESTPFPSRLVLELTRGM